MSVNIQTSNGLKKIADKTTKKTIKEALGYIPVPISVEEVKDEVKKDVIDIINTSSTYASRVIFDDGVSLAEKYAKGELGSGGGGGVDDDIILTTSTSSTIACVKGDTATIEYSFAREVQTTRLGNERVYVDGVLHSSKSIGQGNQIVTLTNLTNGTHTIEIQVSSGSLSSSLVFSVEVIELSISSTFDGFAIYTNPITYRYTPVGNVEKTMHFVIDEEDYTQVVSESNKAMTYQFETLSHGNHKVSVYATAKVGTKDVSSNVLTYDLVVNNGGAETIIGCPFSVTKATQGDLLQFNYVIFTPDSLTSEVSLKINGEVVSNLTVDRTLQTWSLRDYPAGDVVFTIESGNKNVSFEVKVSAMDVKIEAITHNLELHLSSVGRSNNEDVNDREVWESNEVKVNFNGFNWKSNGWIQDNEGNSVLRINGDARITIPFKMFEKDFRSNGKTIEFEFSTHDVRDYDSILINCLSNGRGFSLTSNNAKLFSELTRIETKFKEDEKVRVSFVIEPTSENRLIYTYINGVLSGLIQYPNNDNFSQSNPVGISIGSNDATIDLYNVRVYNINLDHSDMLTNFIADTPDRITKFNLYTNNDIFDTYGNINYNQVIDRIPCLTFIGELPATKGDKKTVSIKYINKFDSSKNFESSSVTLDIQGTSSQYFPRKNYKFKLPNVYKLTNDSIPETVFCLKADYMESSHSHNTGLAKIVNTLYPETPASQANEKVQAAITGFPIVVWYKENENATVKCLGVYNFNNDKDDTTTFGYTSEFPNCESWEFTNNTSAHCLFQNSNFVDTVEVAKNFEARYPDKYTNYTNLSRVVSWVVSTEGDLEKFKNEFSSYFNLESTLLYYCLTELFAMVDSRAKNLFLTTWDGNIWYPTFYDMDTAFGLNNEGKNVNNYNVEYHDIIGTKNAFNGESSVLWNNFEQVYADEIQEFYNNLRNNKLVTYDTVMSILYEQQISKICESNYNYDSVEKYKNPLVNEGDGTYIYCAQGNRLDHLKWWLYNRINYMDSKYVASDYKDNYITLRIYTPQVYGSVIPNADAHITPYADQYVTVKYDENMFNARGTHDVETVIEAPNQIFNDTPMIIYGASRISDIGDLSPLYAGTVDVSKGIKLKQLIIGNSASDYSNTNLEELSIGNNELLTKLDVRNCPSLTQTIDVSGCTNIEEIYATGTSTTAVKVPNGGNLKVLHLPNTITNLTILNQPFITDFVCGSFNKINTLRLENTPLDSLLIVQQAINSLERVRLTNVNWTLDNSTLLDKFMTLKGLNEKGENTEKAVITGSIHINASIYSTDLKRWKNCFGTVLTITANEIIYLYNVKFVDYLGNVLQETIVNGGTTASYTGETPTKPTDYDLQEKYRFSNWSPNINEPINDDTTFTPQFAVTKFYKVLFNNWDGTTLQSDYIDEGGVFEYTGEIPVKPTDTTLQEKYEFSTWYPSINTPITKNTTFTPVFKITKYYEVIFKDWDGTILQSNFIDEGQPITYTGETPTKPINFELQESYTFSEWSPNINTEITSNTTFIPIFNISKFYEVLFKNWDGSIIQTSYVDEGKYATYNGSTPTRPTDETLQERYEFSTWSPSISIPITKNTTFTPVFTTSRYYKIVFKNWDGSILQSSYVDEGEMIEYLGETPTGPVDEDYVYEFAGWDKEFSTATSNMTITATFKSNRPTMFTLELTDSNYLQPLIYIYGLKGNCTIDWGDGNTESVTLTKNSEFIKPTKYEKTGTYTIKVLVGDFEYNDNDNDINNNNAFITVNNPFKDPSGYSQYITKAIFQEGIYTNINKETFKGSKISSITIPQGVKYISMDAFKGCSSLTTVSLPDSLKDIESYAFSSCSNLQNIILPDSVTEIESYAFYFCSSLKSIELPSKLTKIPSGIFQNSGLTSIEIPNSVTKIDNMAFNGCKLTSVTIPENVITLAESAFSGITWLDNITMESEIPPTLKSGQSITVNQIRVPMSAVDAYKSATNWSDYADLIVGY